MFRTLRARLILSHVIPLLLITPLMGLILIYELETQVLLPGLTQEMEGEAQLTAELTRDYAAVWQDPAYAREVLQRVHPKLAARVMLLDIHGRLLASSDPADAERLGSLLAVPELDRLAQGQPVSLTRYSQYLHSESADVLVPVVDDDGNPFGIVRLTYPLESIYVRFIRMRYLIAGVMTAGLILGTIIGSLLALDIGRPIGKITQAVYQLTVGNKLEPLPETGPEETRLLLRSINALVERLHGLEEARHQLLANLVHELGRPLGALRSAMHALMKGAMREPELAQELLAGMDEEALRLQGLLDELSHLHEQVLGPLELNRRPVDLGEWLPRVLAPWRAAALEKRLRWELRVQPGLPVIEIDPARISQALGNLVGNAIKFTPPPGEVRVEAGGDDKVVWIRVADSGPGIPDGESEQIFKPFYRGKRGRRFPQGMGLGLAIAHSLVEAHGGRLDFVSTPGLGTQFTIRLPVGEIQVGEAPYWQL